MQTTSTHEWNQFWVYILNYSKSRVTHPIGCTHFDDDTSSLMTEISSITAKDQRWTGELRSHCTQSALNEIFRIIFALKCLDSFPQATRTRFLTFERLSGHGFSRERHVSTVSGGKQRRNLTADSNTDDSCWRTGHRSRVSAPSATRVRGIKWN